MIGVDNAVVCAKNKFIRLSFVIRPCQVVSSLWPIGDIPQHAFLIEGDIVQGIQQGLALVAANRGDQVPFFCQRHQGFGLEQIIIFPNQCSIAGIHVIIPNHLVHLQMPFGWPGGMHHQMINGVAGHFIDRVNRIMRKLIDEGICLIRDALTISVDIETGHRGGFDGMFAEIPDLVQHCIRTHK